jgi:MFS superfamily sulfate permease-like transporter
VSLLPRRADWTAATRRPGRNLLAGLMVGLVALPMALGFGVSSGMGAGAGLVTAVVAGLVAAVFGGSNVQVSGPTGAMTVVLIPIIAEYGADGVLVVGLLAGLILLGLAYAGLGRFMRYVPIPVVEGFTLGIALIIGLQQLPTALGVDVHAESALGLAGRAVRAWLRDPAWTTPGLAAAVVVLILGVARLRPSLPIALLAVALATAANSVIGLDAATIGSLPSGLPAPAIPHVPWAQLDALVLPAVAVAALAGLESLLSASVSDAMSVGHRHDPDRELFGQGLANLASPLFGGMPATAAIARTAVNVRAGASSRLASVTHAVVLLAVMLIASQWVADVPLAALAGVLLATAAQMVRVSSITTLLRATRGDAVVLVITASATIVADLVTAVILGLVVAGWFALRQTALSARLLEEPLDDQDHADEERAVLDEQIVVFRLDGPLFFAAAHDFLLELSAVSDVRVVVLRMSRITTIDATGAAVLADTITRLESRGTTVLLSGVRAHQEQVLATLGVYDRLASEHHLFGTTPEAIAHARVLAARSAHRPDPSDLDVVATQPEGTFR